MFPSDINFYLLKKNFVYLDTSSHAFESRLLCKNKTMFSLRLKKKKKRHHFCQIFKYPRDYHLRVFPTH